MLSSTMPDDNPPATGSSTPWPILMVRGLIDDGVPSRLGADAFTLACVLVSKQDQIGRKAIGFWREQLCKLCGFPASNTERLRSARKALKDDGWLGFTSPPNGERGQTFYEMNLKAISRNPSSDPGEIRSAKQLTPNDIRSGEGCTRADSVVGPGRNPSSDPGEIRTPSLPSISLPNSFHPKENISPHSEGKLFADEKPEQLESPPRPPGGTPSAAAKRQTSVEAQARQIYEAYPRRVKPLLAMKAIIKALKTTKFEDLLALTQQYAKARSLPGQCPQYTPHPSTWFNEGRWQDDQAEWLRLDDASNSTQTIPGAYSFTEAELYGSSRKSDPTRVRTGQTVAAIQKARAAARTGPGQKFDPVHAAENGINDF